MTLEHPRKKQSSPLSPLPLNSYLALTKQHCFIHDPENCHNHCDEQTPCPLLYLSWNQPNSAGAHKFCSPEITGARGPSVTSATECSYTYFQNPNMCSAQTHDLICSSKLTKPHLQRPPTTLMVSTAVHLRLNMLNPFVSTQYLQYGKHSKIFVEWICWMNTQTNLLTA